MSAPRESSLIRRIAKWSLLTMAALVAVVTVLLIVLLATPPGARFAISTGLGYAPMPVTISGVSGTLAGPLTLEGIEVDNEGMLVRVERVVFDWKPLGIIRKRVVIDSLHVTGVDVFVPADYGADSEPPPPREGPITVPELPVEVQVGDARIDITRVVLEDRAELGASTITASGSIDAFEVTSAFTGQATPVEVFAVNAEMSGSPDAYRLGGELSFTSEGMPPVTATLASQGSLSDLRIDEAIVRTANGEARMTAQAAWYPDITWDVSATADGFEVAPFMAVPEDWPGAVSFRAHTEGRMTDAGPEAVVTLEDLSGNLREQPLSGGVDLDVAPEAIELGQLDLTWGGIQLDADGTLVEALDLRFAFDVPDLGLALPGASGSAAMNGTVSGTRDAPHVVATFEATEIVRDSLRLATATGEIDVDLAEGARSRLDVRASSVASGATVVDSIVMTGGGTREAHAVALGAWMEGYRLGTGLSGAITQEEGPDGPVFSWAGTLDSIDVDTGLAGTWALDEPAAVFAAVDTASLEEACLAQGEAHVCATGGWKLEGAAQGALTIARLPLALLATGAPEGTTVDGTLDGDARFAMDANGGLAADGTFQATGTLEATVGTETARFSLGGEGLTLLVDESGARADADFSLLPEVGSGSFEMTGSVTLPGYNSLSIAPEDQSVEGRVEAGSEDLAFVSVFTPQLTEVGGTMELEADVTGTLAAPSIRGSIAVAEGRGSVAVLGLQVTELTLDAEGDPDGGIDISGGLRSGDGTFAFEGRSPTVPSPDEPARIQLTGERFLAVATPEIQVEIEPDLDISYDGTLTTVEGTVAIPWARVELLEVPEVAVPPSLDVVFVNEENPPPPQVDARVQVVVGDDVNFSGFGFTSMIEGDLQVREEPGALPLVLGELRLLNGRFAAYGQNLDVDPGRLIFSGPAEDASLDVTALRQAQDGTTAGLIVTGSVIEPDIVITSEPAMSDADALSYIIYGKSMSDGDPSQQQRVAGAAATLGANVLTTRLAGSVGLDEARIEGATKDTAELVAGKYLTPSVFVSYGMGLFKPSSTFRVKYLLSSSWALQAESGDANGGDVLYQIERGK